MPHPLILAFDYPSLPKIAEEQCGLNFAIATANPDGFVGNIGPVAGHAAVWIWEPR
jgi:hypothetical protein